MSLFYSIIYIDISSFFNNYLNFVSINANYAYLQIYLNLLDYDV